MITFLQLFSKFFWKSPCSLCFLKVTFFFNFFFSCAQTVYAVSCPVRSKAYHSLWWVSYSERAYVCAYVRAFLSIFLSFYLSFFLRNRRDCFPFVLISLPAYPSYFSSTCLETPFFGLLSSCTSVISILYSLYTILSQVLAFFRKELSLQPLILHKPLMVA